MRKHGCRAEAACWHWLAHWAAGKVVTPEVVIALKGVVITVAVAVPLGDFPRLARLPLRAQKCTHALNMKRSRSGKRRMNRRGA